MRIKEQETRPTLQELDDDDDEHKRFDYYRIYLSFKNIVWLAPFLLWSVPYWTLLNGPTFCSYQKTKKFILHLHVLRVTHALTHTHTHTHIQQIMSLCIHFLFYEFLCTSSLKLKKNYFIIREIKQFKL